jgi:signal transduction histidine kinase
MYVPHIFLLRGVIMKKQTKSGLLLLAVMLLIASGLYGHLFRVDNKYTAALPGGYGYNILQSDPERVAFLVDGWEYYPGQLLEPADFAAGKTPEQYTYIGEYPNFSEHLDSPYGTATYRLILQSDGGEALAIFLPELLCAGRIYINGVLMGEQGSPEPYAPRVMDGLYPFTATGSTELIIQCANYTHYYSGMYYPPAVGTSGAIFRMLAARLGVYGFLCFAALAVSLTNLVQWLLGRNRLVRWMGLMSLTFALRVSYPFLRALGVPLISSLYALEDLCAGVILLCAICMAGELSGAAVRGYHRRWAVPATIGFCVFTVVFPLLILPYVPGFINIYGLLLFMWKLAAGLYLVFLSLHTLQDGRPLGQYLLCAAGLYGLSVAASVVTANRFEPIYGAWLEEYGGFMLVAGFTAMMVRRCVLMARENWRLSQNLQKEVDRKTHSMETLLKERRELLAHLLHDLKNPMTALRAYAELVRKGNVALDVETAAYLDALTERVEVVGERFELLQDFSRGERNALQMQLLCLNEFLRKFHADNQPDMELAGQTFCLELPRRELMIRGDKERLRIALENLCYNALFFTPPDGTVTLSLKQEDQYAVIEVRDTGTGIPQEDLPHLFEYGFTRRAEGGGEGLGLYIVRNIALEHGGSVKATSRPGRGSVFSLQLPTCSEI